MLFFPGGGCKNHDRLPNRYCPVLVRGRYCYFFHGVFLVFRAFVFVVL